MTDKENVPNGLCKSENGTGKTTKDGRKNSGGHESAKEFTARHSRRE
jgi:hypothetical protein